jgi:DNA-directed RNA polymerase subunit RPC12/RpoP
MFFSMRCPHCGKSLKVREEHEGKTARCPYCRNTLTVRRPPDPPPPPWPAGERGERKAGERRAAESGDAKAADAAPQQAGGPPPAGHVVIAAADTNVSVVRHVVIGAAAAAVVYLAVVPLKGWYVNRLLVGGSSLAAGGWVPIAELFLFFWAVSMLVEKWLKIRRQRRSLLYDLLPMELGETITLDNLDRFVSHIRGLPRAAGGSFIVTRCLRGLEHFRVRKSAPDTVTMMNSQSEMDLAGVDSSYTMFHVFIWAIPILGFLGTVIGVSGAVGSFTGTLEGSSDIGALKEALKGITGGLATAFDTTLVALSMAMILTFPVSGLQKAEDDLLAEVDDYANENLLRRLDDRREGGAERGLGGSRGEVGRAIEAALAPHREELAAWAKKLASIGDELAGQVQRGWGEVNAKLVEEHDRQSDRLAAIDMMLAEGAGKFDEVARDAVEARERASVTMQQAATEVQSFTATLERAIGSLAATLERLDGERIVVESHRRPWWRSLFGGGRANGRHEG